MAITPQGIVFVILGLFVCFSGYSMFKSMLPLWGFILGGLAAITFVPGFFGFKDPSLIVQIIAFVVGGIVGAFIASPLYYVSVFLSGAAMGGVVGIIVGSYLEISNGVLSFRALNMLAAMKFPPPVETPLQLILVVVLGIVTGGLAIAFQKFMIIASTSFLGSTVIVAGGNTAILELLRNNPGKSVWLMLIWLILALIGMFVQYRMQGET